MERRIPLLLSSLTIGLVLSSCEPGRPDAATESWRADGLLECVEAMRGDVEWHALAVADAGDAQQAVETEEDVNADRMAEHLACIEGAAPPGATTLLELTHHAAASTESHHTAVFAAASRDEVAGEEAAYQSVMQSLLTELASWTP